MQTTVARSVVGIVIALGSAGIIEAQGAMGPAELAALDSGRQVVREERDTRSAWPRVTIRQFIAASPSQSAAVFADYARHATYLPGLKRASIAKQVSSTVAEVDYILDVPLFPDEWYTVRDSISRGDDGASYRIDWRMVRARSTRSIVGSAHFQPYRTEGSRIDGTLLTYDNLVVPGQALAGALKGRALNQVRETVAALVAEIERVRREEPERMEEQARALRGAIPP